MPLRKLSILQDFRGRRFCSFVLLCQFANDIVERPRIAAQRRESEHEIAGFFSYRRKDGAEHRTALKLEFTLPFLCADTVQSFLTINMALLPGKLRLATCHLQRHLHSRNGLKCSPQDFMLSHNAAQCGLEQCWIAMAFHQNHCLNAQQRAVLAQPESPLM